ncbi:MAG: HU family DNA-binding protein [Pseudomonadota bacterium]
MAVKRKTTKKKAPVKRKAAAKKTTAKRAPAKRAPAKRKTTTKRKTAAKKAAPAVVTLKHLAAEIAEDYEMPKRQAEEVLSDFIDRIGANLKKGQKIRIPGLGILQVRHRAARMGRNPATGESIRIKASKKVAFRVAKDLKERVL